MEQEQCKYEKMEILQGQPWNTDLPIAFEILSLESKHEFENKSLYHSYLKFIF